jgi:ABC-type thiamin/hydroxymethylpyrimidine transport system permease subunit
MTPYTASIVPIALAGAVLFFYVMRRKMLPRFSVHDLAALALFCSLLYVAVLPFKLGLGRIPFVNAFLFSIPFTAVLFTGIRIVPKPGSATLLICGYSLLSQITLSGLNPLWWPYALLAGFVLESYFLLTGQYLETLPNAAGAGILRGLTVYLYFYLFSAPYIWHKFYAPWYIIVQTLQGVAGSCLGAVIGYILSKPIIRAYRQGGI